MSVLDKECFRQGVFCTMSNLDNEWFGKLLFPAMSVLHFKTYNDKEGLPHWWCLDNDIYIASGT